MESNPAGPYGPKQMNEKKQKHAKISPVLRPLRYRRLGLCLLVFYVAILLIPWVVTCVMMVRPLNASSYEQQGTGLPAMVVLDILVGWDVIAVFEKIQAVLAIPIVSGFLAQAAVVYAQRRSPDQKLSLRQLIALADRPWGNVILWYRCVSSKIAGRLVVLGGLLILLVAATPAVQSILVRDEAVQVASCADMPVYTCNPANIDVIIGLDPEPYDMQFMPQNLAVQYVSKKTQMVSLQDFQPYLWPEEWTNIDDATEIERSTFSWYYSDASLSPAPKDKFFVSAQMNGTNTGVLRQHAVRLNSTSSCEFVPQAQFPQDCPGERPFVTRFSAKGTVDIRICVPGSYGKTPWTLSRDRQDITEELWIDALVYDPEMYDDGPIPGNFTQHCTANTTRGYFEVSNVFNGNNPGPILEKWPSQEELIENYNDYLGVQGSYAIPSTVNNYSEVMIPFDLSPSPLDPFNVDELYAAGPLMTSALALFGNQSFLYTASNANDSTADYAMLMICQFDLIPLTRFLEVMSLPAFSFSVCGSDLSYTEGNVGPTLLPSLVYNWISMFNDTFLGPTALDMAMYFANEAVLTSTAAQGYAQNSREIYYSSGAVLVKPQWSLAAVITISILIGLQIFSLCLLMAYILSVPTWTTSLDAFAMVRIGAELQRVKHVSFAGIRDTDDNDLKDLDMLDGLIGVDEDDDHHHTGEQTKDEQPQYEVENSAKGYPLMTLSNHHADSAARLVDEDDDEISQEQPLNPPKATTVSGGEIRDERARKEGLSPPFRLTVGAPGLITRRLAPRMFARNSTMKDNV